MELYKLVLLWFSICATSVYNAVNIPSETVISKVDVLDLSTRNSGYNLYKAYESAIAIESEYEWSISVHNLPKRNRDSGSFKCGPMCITYIRSKTNDDWVEYHRTDFVWKRKPATQVEFAKQISVPVPLRGYYSIRFELCDVCINEDEKGSKINFDSILGYVEHDLRRLRDPTRTILGLEGKNHEDPRGSYLVIHSEKMVNNFDLVHFELSGTKLDYVDRRTELNPYVNIYKRTAENDYVLIWRTEVIYNSSDPEWWPIGIPIKHLCNGNYERTLKFVCMDFDEDGNDHFVGEFETTLKDLADHTNIKFDLIHPNKKTGSGRINFGGFFVIQLPSFSEYIAKGLRLHHTIAIDFTGTNNSNNSQRPPNDTSDPEPNGAYDTSYKDDRSVYEKALVSISTLIEDFDRDRKLLLLGYGLQNRGDGSLDDVDGSKNDHHSNSAECIGTEVLIPPMTMTVTGVLEAYHKLLSTARLSGSSLLSPIIRRFAHAAKTSDKTDEYSILVILTGGLISDLDETKEALIEVSKLRAIILIVGVGDSTFESIGNLIADNEVGAEDCGGNVHFIDFKRFRSFDMNDVGWYLGREFFLTRRDPLTTARKYL